MMLCSDVVYWVLLCCVLKCIQSVRVALQLSKTLYLFSLGL
ncbi:hypothetical protein Hanom_Chr00s023092g01762331 [Helianthus anomalus]